MTFARTSGIRVTRAGIVEVGEGAGRTIRIATGMGDEAANMAMVRTIGKGERIADIIQEGKRLTFNSGNEHALVKLADGSRAIIKGGPNGITWAEGQVTRLFGHTHPYQLPPTGPSALDFNALESLGQRSSYLFERGQMTRFSFVKVKKP